MILATDFGRHNEILSFAKACTPTGYGWYLSGSHDNNQADESVSTLPCLLQERIKKGSEPLDMRREVDYELAMKECFHFRMQVILIALLLADRCQVC